RDSLLIGKVQFIFDLLNLNERLGHISDNAGDPPSLRNTLYYFLPPYEWYNDTIAAWTKEFKKQLINYTPGTLSHADYTTTKDKNYRSSELIYQSIIDYEKSHLSGLNGFVLLMHIGAGPDRPDKFYNYLGKLITYLRAKGYHFQ